MHLHQSYAVEGGCHILIPNHQANQEMGMLSFSQWKTDDMQHKAPIHI